MSIPGPGPVGFGLLSAATLGAADFAGGLATRRLPFALVIAVSHACGLLFLAALAFATDAPAPAVVDLVWGLGAGLSALVGLATLYRALALGRMGLAAPVSGVLAAVVPVGVTAAMEGLPAPAQLMGFALGLVSVWLIARSRDPGAGLRGLGLAVVAGLAFGTFFVLLGQVAPPALPWSLTAARAASAVAATALALPGEPGPRPPLRPLFALVVLAGLLDVAGSVFYALAVRSTRLDVAAVLSSLYPASTVILARIFLRERLGRTQLVGLALALVAIVLINRR